MPPQQSALVTHTSPGCAQNDEALHTPFEHRPEQQSPLATHALPRVLHPALSVPHTPPEHVPLQHAAFPPHALPSEMHGGSDGCTHAGARTHLLRREEAQLGLGLVAK